MGRYLVKCLDAQYDEEDEILVLFCLFQKSGEKKIVHMPRKDFNYRGNEVPHIEMHRTAQAFCGKPFWLDIEDDPIRNREAEENPIRLANTIKKEMNNNFDEITEGLTDPVRQSIRGLDKERLKKLLNDEIDIRKALGDNDVEGAGD